MHADVSDTDTSRARSTAGFTPPPASVDPRAFSGSQSPAAALGQAFVRDTRRRANAMRARWGLRGFVCLGGSARSRGLLTPGGRERRQGSREGREKGYVCAFWGTVLVPPQHHSRAGRCLLVCRSNKLVGVVDMVVENASTLWKSPPRVVVVSNDTSYSDKSPPPELLRPIGVVETTGPLWRTSFGGRPLLSPSIPRRCVSITEFRRAVEF